MTNEVRASIYKSIWDTCNSLRGAVDGWDFKNYVLGTMFYRYLSEHLEACAACGYADMTDTEAEGVVQKLIAETGCFLLPSDLFCNVCKRADKDSNLADTLEGIFHKIEAFPDFAGLLSDFDFNSSKLGATPQKRNERIAKLLHGIEGMAFGDSHESDMFGDAYEYLMTMYASSAGKSGGEFFTPLEVSDLLARIGTAGREHIRSVYDPSCGSGSLLLMAKKVLGNAANEATFYGQDINATTYNLCRINMILHGVPMGRFNIVCEDTLTAPQHLAEKPFDLIVSNPPYSVRWAGTSNPDLMLDWRFSPAGVLAPKSKADLAFVMHVNAMLAPFGTAAIVCFPGILYRGGSELTIRQYLVDNNFIDTIIQLPTNLFFNTSISTVILVLKHDKEDSKILFVDASKEFAAQKKQNKLMPENIANIVAAYTKRVERPHFAHLADLAELRENGYNLSVSSYVEPESDKEEIDIVALNAEIKELETRNQAAREKLDALVAEIEEMLHGVNRA